ncbi:uncharacterized protein TRAVEDRAFT_52638 [Trametes versicolor FP-101664 SS1]|uniref:uncharacterized protein n=1 Tax=Trametes versicolor (strain FP-101664) TaxID=717944 RepID=UPI00046214EA|nr:uncharacterized protein TRAVEDRAFT_52638 [Trametes versicolor FP-101664 SS1]EIW53510.1 hypothetical protein TRAVEDRAFT_52638 [Trametes versicolor FP-101664 SS1]
MATNASTPTTNDIPIQLPSLSDSFGALFIGMCICIFLSGLTLHQAYRYFRLYPQDQKWLKVMVLFIWVSETLHTIMIIHVCYYHLVTNYFNPVSLGDVTWSLRLLAPISVVAMVLCQGFYVRRVYMISPRYRLLVAIAVVLLTTEFVSENRQLAFMIYLTVLAFIDHDLQEFNQLTESWWLVSAIYGLAFSVDSLVTGVLIMVLLKSRTGFKSTDSLIQTLIVYSINSGLVTSISGILSFIFALVISGNMIYIAMGVVATKFYATSVLAVLNARRSLSESTMDGFTTNTAHFGGNLQPAMSSAAFASTHSTHPVTFSLSPISEGMDTAQLDTGSNSTMAELTGAEKV